MKKLYLPYLFDADTAVEKAFGAILFAEGQNLTAFYNLEEAKEAGRKLALSSPKGKVLILETTMIIEPRRVEFAEKVYNSSGELVI